VESVAWITERKNTQPMVFFLLSILLYLRFEGEAKRRWYILSLLTFLLALLSKTSVVMLPVVLLGCVWWEQGRVTGRDLLRTLPFFLLAGGLGLVTIWFQYNVAIGEDVVRTDGFLSRVAAAGMAVWFYLAKALVPIRLTFVYPRWEVDPLLVLSYMPALLVIAFLATFWRYRHTWGRPLLFGFGYYVCTLLPVLGFFNIYFMKYSLVADHWQYTPIAGIIALAAGLGTWAWQKRQESHLRRMGMLASTAVVALLGVLSWDHCRVFSNAETLWKDTLAKNPSAWPAHHNLAVVLVRQERYEEAVPHYQEALRIHPDFAEAHSNLGYELVRQGRIEEAVRHCREALRIKPSFEEAHNNLGIALASQGRLDEAIRHFSEAVRIKPRYADAHNNLGIALTKQGKFEEAIGHHRQTLQINPDYADAHNNLGIALYKQGKLDRAMHHYAEALRIDPDHPSAGFNFRLALQAKAAGSRNPRTPRP
jgi:tetratricopeptide (TPR) repeat protein